MSKFIYFTPEEKARAQNTDLVSLLRAQGERPVRSGREFRTPNDPSITVRGNKWFDHSKREGGYAVSFVQRYYRLPYPEAVLLLLGRKNGKSYEQAKPVKEAPKPFALPELMVKSWLQVITAVSCRKVIHRTNWYKCSTRFE